LDGDGVAREMAMSCVGAGNKGGVFLIRVTPNATLASYSVLASGRGGLPYVSMAFGASLSPFTDWDGDGIAREFAVGLLNYPGVGTTFNGGVCLIALNADLSVKSYSYYISDENSFGISMSDFITLSGDGASTQELLVGTGVGSALISVNAQGQVAREVLIPELHVPQGASFLNVTFGRASIFLRLPAEYLQLGELGCSWPTTFKNGTLSCRACPAGTIVDSEGACNLCPVNHFSDETNSSECTPCPPKTHAPVGARECLHSFPAWVLPVAITAGILLLSSAVFVIRQQCLRTRSSRPEGEVDVTHERRSEEHTSELQSPMWP
jgi:hypothetical protein